MGSSLHPTHLGHLCGTHHRKSRGDAGLLQALSKVAYLSTVFIQLALQLLPPDSLVLQLGLQLPHSPAKSKGDKQSMKHIPTCPGYSTGAVPLLRTRSVPETSAVLLTPAVLGGDTVRSWLPTLSNSSELQLSTVLSAI